MVTHKDLCLFQKSLQIGVFDLVGLLPLRGLRDLRRPLLLTTLRELGLGRLVKPLRAGKAFVASRG